MRIRRTPAVLVLVVASLAGAACASESKNQQSVSASESKSQPPQNVTPRPAATGEVTVPQTGPCLFTGTTDPKRAGEGAPVMLLTDVRAGGHGCFDRVVFEFRPRPGQPDGPIGYTVEYRPGPITEDPSDKPVPVKGSAFLVVRLDATGFDLSKADAPATYTGSPVVEADATTRIQQVRRAGDFEGVTTWVIGVDSQRPFRVTTEQSPTRLVIDVGDG
jgi:hypothetical protein